MKARNHMRIPLPLGGEVIDERKVRVGQRVEWQRYTPATSEIDLNPTLHTVEIDMANGTLLPVETNIIPPSTPQINDTLNIVEQNIFEHENEINENTAQ